MSLINSTVNPRIDLHNVDFEFKMPDEGTIKNEEVHLQMHDEMNIREFDEENVYIMFTRKVFHEPDCYFHVFVTLGIEYDINKESEIELTESNLMKELHKNENMLLYPVSQKASLLISNITNADDDLLIITPPYFIEKSEENNEETDDKI